MEGSPTLDLSLPNIITIGIIGAIWFVALHVGARFLMKARNATQGA